MSDDIAPIDESVFNQLLSISAVALGKLKRDPESMQLEVSVIVSTLEDTDVCTVS